MKKSVPEYSLMRLYVARAGVDMSKAAATAAVPRMAIERLGLKR